MADASSFYNTLIDRSSVGDIGTAGYLYFDTSTKTWQKRSGSSWDFDEGLSSMVYGSGTVDLDEGDST